MMQNQTDISTISDITLLKSYAFDEIAKLEQAQNNLRLLQGRIAELSQETPVTKK